MAHHDMKPSATATADPLTDPIAIEDIVIKPDVMEAPGRILVVDDVMANVRLLSGILRVEGFDVIMANSGEEALEVIQNNAIDVVLLDVMMPQMDGFEVCRHLKEAVETSYIPVVMVTALQDSADRVRAIEAGADDFLTKPVDEVEVVARARSLVRAKRNRERVETAYRELQRAEDLRDSLTAMLVHDLRTPLTTLLVPLEMLQAGDVGPLNDLQSEMIAVSARGARQLLSLVNELLDISKLESGTMQLHLEETEALLLVNSAVDQVASLAASKNTRLDLNVPLHLPTMQADDDLLLRVLVNLLANAIKFTASNTLVRVGGAVSSDGESVVFSVQDNGEGIHPDDRERIFSKFGQVQTRQNERRTSTGLGLTFCKLAVEAHGGRIWVESELGHGSTFFVSIPVNPPIANTEEAAEA
ncbi:MAG: two-component system, sensor histidine kinase and response regulator [Abditibacteriota bacterium]|nr:two-component system, sensor histidine kinase and response regulator [Abditibacteriota bacterium]